jgi:flagellar hook protein FlgE
LRAYRQQLLASNIANANTPSYKAVDNWTLLISHPITVSCIKTDLEKQIDLKGLGKFRGFGLTPPPKK